MMGRQGIAAGIIAAAFVSHQAEANPWLRERGAGEEIVAVTVSKNSAGFAPGGQAANGASNFHYEYGIHERVTFLSHADLTYTNGYSGGSDRARFDTAWTGGRFGLWNWGDAVLSTEIEIGLASVFSGPWPSQRESLSGAGQARLAFGSGFPVAGRHGFVAVEVGWRWRGGAPADEGLLDTTFGFEPWANTLVMLQSFSVTSTGAVRAPYRRYQTQKLQFSVAQQFGGAYWLQLGLGETVAGTDAGNVGALLAFWHRF